MKELIDSLLKVGCYEDIPGITPMTKLLEEQINEELEKRDVRNEGGFYEYIGYRVDRDGVVYILNYDKEYLYGHSSECRKDYSYEPEEEEDEEEFYI